jgi:WXG100 family type VII secretion target
MGGPPVTSPGSGYTVVTPDQVKAINSFNNTAQQAQSALTNLQNELDTLMNQYKGDQASAYQQAHNALTEKVQQAAKDLNALGTYVNKAKTQYTTGDTQQAQTFQQTTSQASSIVMGRLNPVQ